METTGTLSHTPTADETIQSKSVAVPLFLVSAAALFAEVMLIRWIGTEVRIFAFVQNLALIACFLGFGIGCYRAHEKTTLLPSLQALTILVVMVSFPLPIWHGVLTSLSDMLGLSPDAALWNAYVPGKVTTGERMIGLFFALVVVTFLIMLLRTVMIPFGQYVAHYFEQSPNTLKAYSVNLVGSLVGTWLMAVVSFASLPPYIWVGIIALLVFFVAPLGRRGTVIAFGLTLLCIACLLSGQRSGISESHWSPYQKIEVHSLANGNYEVHVNNASFMTIANRTPEYLLAHPDVASLYKVNSYDSPFQFAQNKSDVLIVGSGAGNDVAAALRAEAGNVDAVEIDPIIYDIGRRLHPEHPYDSPRVHIHINDARNYMRTCKKQFDVIVFALLDSHTGFSGYSNMRIDNYVYTEESFRSAQKLLKPGGVLVLKFEVRQPWTWMGQRFYVMLQQIFGRAPVVYYAPQTGALLSGTIFLESNTQELWERARTPAMSEFLAAHPVDFSTHSADAPPPTSDDWPFVYHEARTIPRVYLVIMVVLLILTYTSVRKVFRPRHSETWHFFFLGAGFLLLETQMINRLALYFGSTWLVNCVALTALLSVLVLANFFVERSTSLSLGPHYLFLLVSLASLYFVPWAHLPYSARTIGILLSAGYSVPVFFAGIIFSESFRRTSSKPEALGSNILGAIAGGALQNLSFIIGIKLLILVAAVIYAASGICQLRSSPSFKTVINE